MNRVQRRLKHKKRARKKLFIISIVLLLFIGSIYLFIQNIDEDKEEINIDEDKEEINIDEDKEEINIDEDKEVNIETDVKEYSDERQVSQYIPGETALYVDGIIVVNKDYELPDNYLPGESEAARDAFEQMKKDASLEGISLYSGSTYRSYNYQVGLFGTYTNRDGENEANTYSAKPGHSEHQTGLAFDIGGADKSAWINSKFDDTKEAKWLYENAYKYGFILRYPEGKEHITGYVAESWHYRYIGTDHSYNFKENNLTLEEYLGIYQEVDNENT